MHAFSSHWHPKISGPEMWVKPFSPPKTEGNFMSAGYDLFNWHLLRIAKLNTPKMCNKFFPCGLAKGQDIRVHAKPLSHCGMMNLTSLFRKTTEQNLYCKVPHLPYNLTLDQMHSVHNWKSWDGGASAAKLQTHGLWQWYWLYFSIAIISGTHLFRLSFAYPG